MRAVIFANGNLDQPEEARRLIRAGDLLIAADGGARHCRQLGLAPSAIIGDLDSLPLSLLEELQAQEAKFITHPRDKEQTDLELALRYAIEQGASQIILLGMSGGRLDQTLANLLLLARKEWSSASLSVVDGPDVAHLLRQGDSVDLNGHPGDLVSLVPLSPTVSKVTTDGLRWSLDGATLEFGSTLGISNEMISPSAHVRIGQGYLLVIHRRYPEQVL